MRTLRVQQIANCGRDRRDRSSPRAQPPRELTFGRYLRRRERPRCAHGRHVLTMSPRTRAASTSSGQMALSPMWTIIGLPIASAAWRARRSTSTARGIVARLNGTQSDLDAGDHLGRAACNLDRAIDAGKPNVFELA